ncbi:transketolase [Suhomyces tanzawaensis NRRL Y-17324]|uniref:Transketolase n=1 Tax=Suhomyces tanzawaensis NRRL Y-17324 TaxID=984487 RepID=A0A1E4SN50_9ASCO|nr:transketolase [Suhomyces tanzawaensis NRRL Y-17324]ODV80954.1 transketolase [Suhomyces tanzawaensis NRRL Y-17324]
MSQDLDQLTINTIRLLSVDAVAAANSGHPGAPLGLAPAAHAVWKQMKFNPRDTKWINRDRFILSNGHACALLYSLLVLYGYDLEVEDLKQFRQLNSKTPGHPEALDVPGVEVTTGPLGQGISNAVGLALAQTQFAATYNKSDVQISNSYTYSFLGDGCLMEGVASEASSLAGHLQLGNLIAFWDDNRISIDGSTEVAFTENVVERYKAYGWHVLEVPHGDTDLEGIANAIEEAKKVTDKPTLIRLTTTIGFGSLAQGTHGVHGSPLKADDIKQLKEKWGFNPEENFAIPAEVKNYLSEIVKKNQEGHEEWKKTFDQYKQKYPELGAEVQRRLDGKLPEGWEKNLPTYTPQDKAVATRKLSEIVLQSVYDAVPELIGGSADLTPSNLTRTTSAVDFQPPSTGLGDYSGRYIRYGVREHGMGAIMNGIAAFGANYKNYGGTFLNFVSYAAGAVRLSALSHHPVTWVATHDSIGLGEDGPTHQPIETLAHFRAIPNVSVWRPADGNETSAAYKSAISSTSTPHIIALTRQNLPQLEGSSIENASKGGYTLVKQDNPDVIIVASGSEVSIAVDASKKLAEEGFKAGVVSLPDFFTFDNQSQSYRLSVLPDGVPIISVEVMSTFGWSKYSHEQFGLNRFGASGKGPELYKFFEFTPEGIADRAAKTIQFYKGKPVLSPLNRAF